MIECGSGVAAQSALDADGGRRMVGKNLRIDVKLVVLSAVLMGLLTVMVSCWSANTHQQQMKQELVEQARGFSQQMDAVWTFVDANQDRINYTSGGEFEFKGLHCSIAAKAVARLFSMNSDYEVVFTRTDPRNKADAPDAWEVAALETFEADGGIAEYYQLTEYGGDLSLRYCVPLRVERGCLQCHGGPAGEIDITGYPKEGWVEGDLAGATSIVIPAEKYVSSYNQALVRDLFFYLLLVMAALIAVFLTVRHLATKPLRDIANSLVKVGHGGLTVKLSDSQSSKEVNAVVSSFNDMTDELNELYNNLERKVADRTEELHLLNAEVLKQKEDIRKANARLEKESAYKSDFMAVMSHELKTPLTASITYLEALQSPHSSLSAEDRGIAMRSEANNRELLIMINNILEVSRSQDVKEEMRWETIDLFDVAEYVVAEIEPLARRKNNAIVRKNDPATPLICSDWEKLRHIMLNLLSNAIKFSHEGCDIVLSVDPLVETGSEGVAATGAVITVTDFGTGISPDKIDEIFGRFARANANTQAQRTGNGLGLFIVKEYAELLGGSVSVTSEVSRGSIFTVTIPAHKGRETDEDDPAC